MDECHAYLEKHERKLVQLVQEMVRVPTVNPPGEQYRQMVDLLRERCAGLGMKAEVHRVPDERVRAPLRISPCVVDPDHDLPGDFARAVQAVRRRRPNFRVTTGFTDLHFFVEDGGLPGVGYGAKGEQAHGVDERVRIRDLVQTARIYAEFMMRGVGSV